ncbi:adhesive plaque matrix protein [Culex pipiens pallens]|uniref:adhesive plaque matrix protein n=1 Tax=Culex pipiens pallens TaxID=42434 RepID=UPI001954EB44|nr:adhesive plaque matrix protein [Culex pipiens pallens]
MAVCRQLTFALFFVCSTLAVEVSHHNGLEAGSDGEITNTAKPLLDDEVLPKLHRQKRHDIEIHRVIKRRPKLPPPRRKPRPPRRPPKPKVKYGPPNVNYPPLTHYKPHGYEDTFSTSYETSYTDQNSFGEPPASYGKPIHPSPTFGSPPFAYGQSSISYQGSSFGKPSFDEASFEGFGKQVYGGSSDLDEFPGIIEGPTRTYSSNRIPNFGGSPSIPSHVHSKSPSYQQPSSFLDNRPSFTSHKEPPSYTRLTEVDNPQHQFPLEGYNKDPYRTPLTSYEVPLTQQKPQLFEPTKDFDSSYKKGTNSYPPTSVVSTHSTSHSSTDSDEEDYYPSLPNRYEQEQFHNPSKQNPNKTPSNSIQTINDNDPFTSFNTYYDGVSESQKVSVKTKTNKDNFSLEEFYSATPPSSKRTKTTRRKKKPKPSNTPVAHNLDTDDLRDAFGSSSDFHQVAIDADEFLEFEPQKQMKHSKPLGVTMTRNESPANFVLLSSQNRQKENNQPNYRTPSSNPNYQKNLSALPASDYKTLDINYFKSVEAKKKPAPTGPIGLEDVSILSVQKSNSQSYYAGNSNNGFQPTRRRNGAYYRANLDYEMMGESDENYDEIGDAGTFGGQLGTSRVKKDLTIKAEDSAIQQDTKVDAS